MKAQPQTRGGRGRKGGGGTKLSLGGRHFESCLPPKGTASGRMVRGSGAKKSSNRMKSKIRLRRVYLGKSKHPVFGQSETSEGSKRESMDLSKERGKVKRKNEVTIGRR